MQRMKITGGGRRAQAVAGDRQNCRNRLGRPHGGRKGDTSFSQAGTKETDNRRVRSPT